MTAFATAPRDLTGDPRADRRRLAETTNPACAVRIMSEHHVRTHAGPDHFNMQGIGDRGGHAGSHGHRQEGTIDAVAVRQTKADVRRTAGSVDLELGA